MEDLVTPSQRLAQSYSGRRVLVTGNTGFKGSWLALWLGRLGAEVTGFADGVPTRPSHFEALGLPYPTIYGDIANGDDVRAAVEQARPEIVFHLAAQSLVRRSYADPVGTYRTNLIGSLILFEACRAEGVGAIVSATTDKVYRNCEWDWGYREIDELGGSDPYSASKSCVELMTRSWRESLAGDGGPRIASVRAGNVIGGGDWAEDRLIPDIMRAAHCGEKLRIRNPSSTRPWQHVLDPLSGYLLVGAGLLAGDAVDEAWNFGPSSQRRIRVGDIVQILRDRLPGLEVEQLAAEAAKKESGLLELDSAKAAGGLGWRPVWEGEMLERTLDWYHAFYANNQIDSEAQLDDYICALDASA